MTLADLQARHGEVKASGLPVRDASKPTVRAFTEEGEERIYLFVHVQRESPELAAVQCRTTKATIYAAINRVKSRLQESEAPSAAGTGSGGSNDVAEANDAPSEKATLSGSARETVRL